MTLAQLQTILAAKGQFLPLDPPLAERCTIGGCIATNASGPSRLRYGSVRDLLLGVRLARADGTVIRGGGKVVKNVAGYDLTRLVIGSLGTLGVIVEATFRLQPLPQMTTLFQAGFDDLGLAMDAVLHAIRSPLQPTALELLNAQSGQVMPQARSHTFGLWARFDAVAKATLERQARDFSRLCRDAGARYLMQVDEWQSAWSQLVELPAVLAADGAAVWLKVSVLPTRVADLGQALEELNSGDWSLVAHAGSGVVYLITRESPHLADVVTKLRDRVRELGGSLVVERAPAEIKTRVGTWGPPRSDFPLMRGLKTAFDPNGILNPGRFIGGV
jgi:glycolate oxidase FAD binding subunit